MKKSLFLCFSILCCTLLFISCNKEEDSNKEEDRDRMCLTNKTQKDWYNATVIFTNAENTVTGSEDIGTLENGSYLYINYKKIYSFFYVKFYDKNNVLHQSEKYYTNPYVDVKSLIN